MLNTFHLKDSINEVASRLRISGRKRAGMTFGLLTKDEGAGGSKGSCNCFSKLKIFWRGKLFFS
jgi:hypothetical protein